jgi:hypothetical protein
MGVMSAGALAGIVDRTGGWLPRKALLPREQVIIFNIVTVGIGVAVLYLALFIAMLAAVLLLVPQGLLGSQLGYPADVADQVRLAWLATSIATLGAALESHETVREAAYTYQPDAQLAADPPERAPAR